MAKRGTTIPVAAWWYEAVKRRMGAMKLPELAEKIGGAEISALSRCLNGTVPTLHLILKISDALKIPRPVFLPQTEQDALVLHGALALRAVDASIDQFRYELNGAHGTVEEGAPPRKISRRRKT